MVKRMQKVGWGLGAAVVLTALGFAVRWAEFNQVGSDNDTSTWIFVLAGLSAYYGILMIFWRPRR